MSAERVREYYRRQGEDRMRSAIGAKLDVLATSWEQIGLFTSADALKTAVAEISGIIPAAELDGIQSVAYNAGKGMGSIFEQDRIIKIIKKHGQVCNFEAVHEHPCDVCVYLDHLAGQIKDPSFSLEEPKPACYCERCDQEPKEACFLCSEACLSCQDKFHKDLEN